MSAVEGDLIETAMMDPLIDWLRRCRILRFDSLLIREFPWQGRLIDLATMTRSGICTAYELKLRHTKRALEQSALNAVAFDRSVIVTGVRPVKTNLARARALGLGVVVVNALTAEVTPLVTPGRNPVSPRIRLKLRSALRDKGRTELGNVW